MKKGKVNNEAARQLEAFHFTFFSLPCCLFVQLICRPTPEARR
jgi:hypothetical protein